MTLVPSSIPGLGQQSVGICSAQLVPTKESVDECAPLGLDEPLENMVWRHGLSVLIPYGHPFYAGEGAKTTSVFLTEDDALCFRITLLKTIPAKDITAIGKVRREPFEKVLAEARERGRTVRILDGQGNEVCR